MKPKALERLALNPGLFDAKALQASRDLYAFDNIFTLERACDAQIAAQSGGAELVFPPESVRRHTAAQYTRDPNSPTKLLAWEAALRLIEDGAARDAAWAEFTERTGGGVCGRDWVPPLCDYPPPIHFRWPEYITTPRGQDWWIPSAMPGA